MSEIAPAYGQGQRDGQAVTLAVLAQKIESLTVEVRRVYEEMRRISDDYEKRLRSLEEDVTTLKGRFTTWQMLQAGYSSIAAGIAGFFGKT